MSVPNSEYPDNLGETTGIVFNIERFAVHDGPGIRTLIFLKGCPLSCIWCANPESHQLKQELWFWDKKCVLCGRCLISCPQKAIVEDENSKRKIIRDKCNLCRVCVEVCPQKAFEYVGNQTNVDEIVKDVLKDRIFIDRDGGGVTISGGEPMLQPKFTLALLKALKKRYVNTAMETSGFATWDVYQEISDYSDLILQDVKVIDENKHIQFTGVNNDIILSNIRKIDAQGKRLIIRCPIIPTLNDGKKDIELLGQFVSSLKNTNEVHLLPYHRLGEPKYQRLGREYSHFLKDIPSQKEESVSWIKSILVTVYQLDVRIGG